MGREKRRRNMRHEDHELVNQSESRHWETDPVTGDYLVSSATDLVSVLL